MAKHILWQMIHQSYRPGNGVDVIYSYADVLDRHPPTMPTNEHFTVWYDLQQALSSLCNHIPLSMVPEVGSNIGFALPEPSTKQDICALSGRIIRTSEGVKVCGSLFFGGSDHIASIILAASRLYPTLRSALNIRYSPSLLEHCKKTDLTIVSFDRAQQPSETDSTMDWGTTEALKNTSLPPDLIYDIGASGKEPMIRILGTNPENVLSKLMRIIEIQNR
jgi:hydroxymethylpyrimidine/phosphomethylpyrimidine kinase